MGLRQKSTACFLLFQSYLRIYGCLCKMPRVDEGAMKLVSPEGQVTNLSQFPGASCVLALNVPHLRENQGSRTIYSECRKSQSSFVTWVSSPRAI